MLTVLGKTVRVHPLLPMRQEREVRPLKAKQWHAQGGRYALRVAKKWRKRYGVTAEIIEVLETKDGYFLSQRAYDELRRQCEENR